MIDQALLNWYAARQDEAMIEQYTSTSADEDAEYAAWTRIRDAAVSDMLSRPRDEG